MMKRLLAKKWFRISVRVSVGCLSLLVLAWMWFNWWAASHKRLAMAEAKKAGLSVKLDDFTKNMPPAEENFARQGLFKQWEDAYQNGWPGPAASPTNPQGLYDSMGDEVFGKAFVKGRGRRPRIVDFSLMPADGLYGQSAASFLAEYDRQFEPVLRDLQAGFGLPQVRRPFLPMGFSGDVSDLPSLSEVFGLKLRRVADGLVLRTEAALATGDSAKAAESIEVILRLAEAVGSRGVLVSALVEIAVVRAALGPIRSGIERHLWTDADLQRISAGLSRLDPRRDMLRAIESEILMIHAIETLKTGAGAEKMSSSGLLQSQENDRDLLGWVVSKKPNWLPDAVFDLNEIEVIGNTRGASKVLSGGGLAQEWWAEAERQFQVRDRRKGAKAKLIWAYPAPASGLKAAAKGLVELRLALVACALEGHRLKHGSYPAVLDILGPDLSRDPFTGGSLRYQALPEGFKLYSIAPNGADDGGERKGGRPFDPEADWIW